MRGKLADFAREQVWMRRDMHYPNISALISDAGRSLTGGPVALIVVEDPVEAASTIAHLDTMGFGYLVALCSADTVLARDASPNVSRVDCDVTADGLLQDVVNGLIRALPDTWFYYCYNAEYLYYPFCEHRNVKELLTFMQEERRDTVMSYIVDLYAQDLGAHPNGVDRQSAHFDKSGYYALARKTPEGEVLERQLNVSGGLRWRFEEHIAKDRQQTDRVSFFRAQSGLQMLPDRSFNIAEYNTHSCPWHNNLTAAVASFRTAKALRRNPGSRDSITSFHWSQSARFEWTSQQLLDLGMMEPGQWF
jgi:hypothetical protein